MCMKIGYVVSRFPKLTETFILLEMVELERRGVSVTLMPLLRQRKGPVHPEAREFVQRARYLELFALKSLASHLFWLASRPRTYCACFFLSLHVAGLGPSKIARNLVTFAKAVVLASHIRATGLAHVHAHWATYPTLAVMMASRLTNCTFSFTAHAHDIFVDHEHLREKVAEAAFARTISDYNRGFLLARVGHRYSKKIQVVRCGIELNLASLSSGTVGAGRNTIVCVGSLEEKKGQAYLLRACVEVLQQGFDFELRFIGGGPLRHELERLAAELGLAERCFFLGPLEREGVFNELQEADLFVLPSIIARNGMMEGIPVALMEAMAAGVPVIATSISGIPELVENEETGLLVPPADVRSLAVGIRRLLGDPLLREHVSLAGRTRVESAYDIRATVDQLIGLFTPLVSNVNDTEK